MSNENQLKFANDIKYEVVVVSAKKEQIGDYEKYVVRFERNTQGHDFFMPSEGLIKKMQEQNVDKGDKIAITKVAPSEKYKYGYFSVDMIQKAGLTPNIESSPVGAGFAQKDTKNNNMDLHELSMRVENLETKVAKLMQNQDIPF